ncbi:putative altered inheritance of mitochondria protein 3 protein [Erysiphe neolycopersici]|uniref:Putative altered inheritance of mitochondria protein 3 protein n=1 Tax=Erysiphe neolycopersici TaxID=212602 RepID=A0A420I2V4_9PEZI|nr:putative altered inheritance of mitochondria protein 3 protein [Erysiphe neolycopersici]
MSGLKDFTKNKLRPVTEGGASIKDRWRDDFKGLNQVAGWIGKGKDQNITHHHVPRPLPSLRDPATFGPPPRKLIDSHQKTLRDGFFSEENYTADKSGSNNAEQRVRTLLPPPTPQRPSNRPNNEAQEVPRNMAVKPNLPPRLPPREKSTSVPPLPSKLQTSLEERITKMSNSNINRASNDSRSEFNRASETFSPIHATASTDIPSTSFSQKKAALKTISSLRSDPSSVSFSEAKGAASTANNIRKRHGDQVESGWHLANKFKNEYGISQKLELPRNSSSTKNEKSVNNRIQDSLKDTILKKRPPPPPPPPSQTNPLGSRLSIKSIPPIIPISTKPDWSPK